MKKNSASLIALLLAAAPLTANAAVTLLDTDAWKVRMNGFIEPDAFVDSTRSFVEAPGNVNVQRADTPAGANGRTQFSIRASRLGFTAEAPVVDEWKTRGTLEFDLLGYDPAPGATNTEASFFNNPTLRVRHAYLATEKDGWQFLAGQTWHLIGFQPNYFIPSIQPVSVTGMLFGRTAQVGVSKTMELGDGLKLQAAVGAMRPPQRDSQTPGLEGGLRLVVGSRSAGFTNGSGAAEKTQPMSFAVSGAVRDLTTAGDEAGTLAHHRGSAFALNALIPVFASGDGTDVGNTLMLGGEYTAGTGYGDTFLNWTGLQASPLATGASASDAEKAVNLDGGIGGFDAAGEFKLMSLTSYNAHLQYHLPAQMAAWISAGYGVIQSGNIGTLVNAEGKTGAGAVPQEKNQIYFANIQHDLTKQLRVGFEFAQTRTDYSDDTFARNNRYQVSAWFMF